MTDDLKASERLCYVNCGLPDDQCACYRHVMSRVRADRIATLEAALADMTQQRDAAMAGAVKVRELVWEQLGERAWRAPSPLFGSFRVECYGGRPWQALWSVPGFCDTFVKGDFATADDAKRAIESRILSALTPDTDRLLALTAAAALLDEVKAADRISDIDRAMLQSMAISFRARMGFSFNPDDMADLLTRVSAALARLEREVG